jgi:hypothetical protein
MRTIRPSHLFDELKANGLAKVNSCIHAGPGEGKSQLVYQFAESIGAKMYELRANLFDPVDVRGGLKVGTYHLPKNTIKIAAGNRAQDRAAVHEMPTPVKNRFAHYTLEANIDDWVQWALKNDIDESLIAFLRYRPMLLSAVDSKENAFPTPRAWEMLNRKLPFMKDDFYGCASLIGDGPAGEYIAFKSIYKEVPDIDALIKSPSTTKVPENASVLYAIAGALASRVNDKNFDAIMKYVRRMPAEYQVVIIRDCMAKDKGLMSQPAFTKWTQDNASVLL